MARSIAALRHNFGFGRQKSQVRILSPRPIVPSSNSRLMPAFLCPIPVLSAPYSILEASPTIGARLAKETGTRVAQMAGSLVVRAPLLPDLGPSGATGLRRREDGSVAGLPVGDHEQVEAGSRLCRGGSFCAPLSRRPVGNNRPLAFFVSFVPSGENPSTAATMSVLAKSSPLYKSGSDRCLASA